MTIVTEGHRGKHTYTKTLWKGPSPLARSITVSEQHNQQIAWSGDAVYQTTSSFETRRRANMENKRRRRKTGTLLTPPLNRPWRAAAVCRQICLSGICFISYQRACTRRGLPHSWILEAEPWWLLSDKINNINCVLRFARSWNYSASPCILSQHQTTWKFVRRTFSSLSTL